MNSPRWIVASLVLLGAFATELRAQDPVIYSTSFDTLHGWVPNPMSGFAWAADATPNGVADPLAQHTPPAGWLPYLSPPASLNFNNGLSLGIEGNNLIGGFVTSPPIDLTLANRVPELQFMMAGWMEPIFDFVTISVVSDPNGPMRAEWSIDGVGDWIRFRFALDRNWGTVRIRIAFTVFDGMSNLSPGPFIDDLQIVDRCDLDPASPCTEFVTFCFGNNVDVICPCGNGINAAATTGCRNSSGAGAFLQTLGTGCGERQPPLPTFARAAQLDSSLGFR